MAFAGILELFDVTAGARVILVLLSSYVLGCAIYNRFFHPYRNFPGPFWASITPLWYWRAARFARADDTQLPLHKKYGPMVRISPDQIQISDPAAIETIYGPENVFPKDIFYTGFAPGISKRAGNFEERDEKKHAIRRRITAPLYTPGSILQFEPCVDRIIALFYEQMEDFAKTGQEFDMATWLRKYAFDVIGEIFYGYKGGFGFIRDNVDYNDWCHLMETMAAPAAANTSVPWGLRNLFFMSELILPSTRVGAMGVFKVVKQARAAVQQRIQERASGKKNLQDLLTRLLDLVNDDPDPKKYWDIKDVTAEIWTMIWAGSDTTAIALTSIFYHLHKHPLVLSKLRREIDFAFDSGALSYPLRYRDCIKIPYLHAVVRESMRVHPSLGTGLPCVVPAGGATICNVPFPAGYGVMMNSCAVHFSREVFGDDCEDFIPERWTRDGKERADHMERHMLQFGYGPRICIGKNITNVEMYKVLPTILRDFEFEGVGPGEKEWKTKAEWFHHQKGVDVKVRRRRERSGGEVVVVPEGKWRDE